MDIIDILHYIDILPYMLGTFIVVVGSSRITPTTPLNLFVVLTTAVFTLAQSSWFSAWMTGNHWGRDWANVVWFLFNTSTMVIFACILFKKK